MLGSPFEDLHFLPYLNKTCVHYCQPYDQIKILSFPLIGALEIILNELFHVNFFFQLQYFTNMSPGMYNAYYCQKHQAAYMVFK